MKSAIDLLEFMMFALLGGGGLISLWAYCKHRSPPSLGRDAR